MKIGILTFSNALNFGAALQAFALQKGIEHCGIAAELIEYHNPQIDNMHKMLPVFSKSLSLKARIYNLLYNIVFFPRRVRYAFFFRDEKRSAKLYPCTIKEIDGQYDTIIVGSDQVFNLKLTGNDRNYFLSFSNKAIKTSYAASMGIFDREKRDEYLKDLSDFKYVSVREDTAARVLLSEIGIKAEVVPDPVFLLDALEWRQQLKLHSQKNEKYLLIYALIENIDLYRLASEIAKVNDLKIISITKALKPKGRADRYVKNAGPKEFLRYIDNADYIVTNSFHGTAFSIIFNKQFTTILPQNAPERITDLLHQLGIEERAVDNIDKYEKTNIDYSRVNPKLELISKHGNDFLQEIIGL